MAVLLVALAITLGWEVYAIPSNTNTVVEPGSLTSQCDYLIYFDGTNYFRENCSTHANEASGTSSSTIIQNALTALAASHLSGSTPLGGSIVLVGTITLDAGITIRIWPGLHFSAHVLSNNNSSFTSGSMITYGNDYVAIGSVIIDGPNIDIDQMNGPHISSPLYSSTGLTAFHAYQMDGGHINIGTIRGFTRYGFWADGGDGASNFDSFADNIVTIGELTSNGVGLRTFSSASGPAGSFVGSNRWLIGHVESNYYGVLFDADTNSTGALTYTNPNSVNNFVWATIEDSKVLPLTTCPPTPCHPEATDMFINSNYGYFVLNIKDLRVRGGGNVIQIPGRNNPTPTINIYTVTSGNVIRAQVTTGGNFTIVVGASPFTVTNLDGYPEYVCVSGGTVSEIDLIRGSGAIQTIVTGATSGCFLEQYQDKIVVTWSVKPVMQKIME